MLGLKKKLETAYKTSGERKVTIISHSMGGVMISCFMFLYPEVTIMIFFHILPHPSKINNCFNHWQVFSKYVGKWITIATPFQGFIQKNLFGKLFIPFFTGNDFGFGLTGAPGCINDSLLTGVQFVEGLESFFFVSRWTMHQLVIYPHLWALWLMNVFLKTFGF